jgi:uncharacterized Zn finger protein (UPF0148 family)
MNCPKCGSEMNIPLVRDTKTGEIRKSKLADCLICGHEEKVKP